MINEDNMDEISFSCGRPIWQEMALQCQVQQSFFRSMLMTPIRIKYLNATNPTIIQYRILTNLIDTSFFLSISHFMGERKRVIVALFSPFSVPYCVESYVTMFVLNRGQGVSSIEDNGSTLISIENIGGDRICRWNCESHLKT